MLEQRTKAQVMESGVNDWQAQTAGQQIMESEGVLTGFSFLVCTGEELGAHSRRVAHLRATPSLAVEPRAEPRSLVFQFFLCSIRDFQHAPWSDQEPPV